MPRRIEIELTSARDDGTWTWRAAGAREPKGTLDAGLLFDGAKVGDVVRADADFDMDGITVVLVLAPREARREPERLELLTAGPEPELVTTNLVERRGGRDRDGRKGDKRRGKRGDAKRGKDTRKPDRDRARQERTAAPDTPKKPKAPRLRPKRENRDVVLAELPPEQRPIAEQVLRGGLPAVRQAIEKQNTEARDDGKPEVKADAIVALAEDLLPRLREAEWRDRADAALAGVELVDLRDLRSVVVAADAAARGPEARDQADALRKALAARVDKEHADWMAELAGALADGRTVRALRLSSRPPKAGSPLPPDLAARLADAAAASMTSDTSPDRYATVIDALAYSPVREQAVPGGVPANPGDQLVAVARKLASRVPQVAAAFEVADARPDAARAAAAAPVPPLPVPPPPSLTADADADAAT